MAVRGRVVLPSLSLFIPVDSPSATARPDSVVENDCSAETDHTEVNAWNPERWLNTQCRLSGWNALDVTRFLLWSAHGDHSFVLDDCSLICSLMMQFGVYSFRPSTYHVVSSLFSTLLEEVGLLRRLPPDPWRSTGSVVVLVSACS